MPLTSLLRRSHTSFSKRLFSRSKPKSKSKSDPTPVLPFPFYTLPTELQLHVFTFLTLQELITARLVSRTFRFPNAHLTRPDSRRLLNLCLTILRVPNPNPDSLSKEYPHAHLDRHFDRAA